jgi:hypothetical protein
MAVRRMSKIHETVVAGRTFVGVKLVIAGMSDVLARPSAHILASSTGPSYLHFS